MLLRREVELYGVGAFFFHAVDTGSIANSTRADTLTTVETWYAIQLNCHDERYGYNLQVGAHRTRGSRFRDHEQKLVRSGKYVLLGHVHRYAPIHHGLLSTWVQRT